MLVDLAQLCMLVMHGSVLHISRHHAGTVATYCGFKYAMSSAEGFARGYICASTTIFVIRYCYLMCWCARNDIQHKL